MNPLITTIIPTYRRPVKLRQVILSALHQTYKNIQVCVYDNASGDETASVVSEITKFDSRVKYHCHSENIGSFNNFQFGLKRVDTPYFSFLSDDDLLLPDFYETSISNFESHPDAIFFAGDVFIVGHNDILAPMIHEYWTPGFYQPPDGLRKVLEHRITAWTGILFKKDVTEYIGYLDEETGMYAEFDYIYRISARYPFIVSKHPCAVFDAESSKVKTKYRFTTPYTFDSRWPGILKMTKNITDDKNLPIELRSFAEHEILGKFEKNLFRSSLRYLLWGLSDDSEKCSIVLNEYFGKKFKSVALNIIIYFNKYIVSINFLLHVIVFCRDYLKKNKNSNVRLPITIWYKNDAE